MARIKQVTKTVSAKQWAKFVPVKRLADNLIHTAGVLLELPPHVRGKIHMSIQIATEIDAATREVKKR